jgi:hypothetical protein
MDDMWKSLNEPGSEQHLFTNNSGGFFDGSMRSLGAIGHESAGSNGSLEASLEASLEGSLVVGSLGGGLGGSLVGSLGSSLVSFASPAEEEEVEAEELVEQSCAYCGLCDNNALLKCIETNKWFCNGRGSTSASHIIQHLIRSKCKQVSLHPDSPLGDTVLECYNCG